MSQSRFKNTLTALLFLACFGLNNCAPKLRSIGFFDEDSTNEGFKVRLIQLIMSQESALTVVGILNPLLL